MQKLVVLKLEGDLVEGVRVTLEIGAEGSRAAIEVRGNLPPKPEMIAHYERWQSTYRSLEDFRITPISISIGGDRTEQLNNCRFLGDELSKHLNSWLSSESFRPLKEKLLKQLTPDDTVRVLIKTSDIWLRRLPWHLWDFFEDYSLAEVALSAPEYGKPPSPNPVTKRDKVKILAILGNSEGIFIEKDRELLETLPNTKITFLLKPQRSKLSNHLWEQDWDILFFAGHSSSQLDGKTGNIYINETDKLTINELKYAIKQAVRGGLQLAIFNSCDGLGLARQLEELHIPQIIVMREPVPDLVAQEFLKHFLEAFSSGQSLYAAVRLARERLQGLEGEYPSASWLPVICQNPAFSPMTWPLSSIPNGRRLRTVLLLSMLITASVLGVRHMGGLQTWELQAYDKLMRSRPESGQDPRLLIVTVTEDDFNLPEQQHRKGSLSDIALARLLEFLAQGQPRTIGLDIYRDFPVQPNQSLLTRVQTADNFFAICKVSDRTKKHPGISSPAVVPQARLGFSDVVQDPDGVLRRHLLAMKPPPASPCTTPYALSAQLAFHYLEAEGISAKYTERGDLQLGNLVLKRLLKHMGGYQGVDAWGYQILLNYRSYHGSPLEIAPTVTLTDVLRGAVKPEEVKDRIVLIGVTAQSSHDYIPTPYSTQQGLYQEMPGVIVQAQMVSQLVSAAKNERPLLSVWPFWGEVLWIWGWSVVGVALGAAVSQTLALNCRSRLYLILAGGGALLVLYVQSLVFLSLGWWVPLVPSALVLVVTGGTVVVYLASQEQRQLIATTSRYE